MGNITHEFVSGIPDGDDESLVKPSNWNADHAVTAPVEDHDVATKEYVDDADEVLDYGLSFRGEITAVTDTTHFTVASLVGMGTGFFKPLAGSPYEIHVVQADGATPEGEQTPVAAFTSSTGVFQHTAFTASLAIGDIVLIQHPVIAALGTKATAAATGAVTTTDYSMAYIKQLVTELQVVDALADAILVDTGTTIPATLATIAGYLDTEIAAILEDTGTTIPAQITALVTDYLGHATHGLAALETLVDSLETWIGDPSGGTLTTITARIGDVARSLDLILGSRWDSSGDLGTDVTQLLTYCDILDNATNGLAAIKAEVEGLAGVAMRGTDSAALASVLGALDTAASTGAVTETDEVMAYLKQIVTGLALDGSAPLSYDYTKATVPGWLHGFHMVRRILFVIPEAIGSITAHNTAIKAVLDAVGLVETITQGDALTYPDYESITITVLGSPLAGTAWTTSNLAHIKAIFGLPVICVDGIAATYLKMGTDGGNAASKTVLNAIANIEASILGMGVDDVTGLAAGANTVAASGVTFSTLDMSNANITEIWYGWETTEDNTDVLLAEIRKMMPDGTTGIDLDGAEVPGTLAFYGCAYSMGSLNTLGQAVFHLLMEKLIHSSTAGLAVLLSGNVGNLVSTIGTKSTPAATGAVSNAKKMMGYIKQLVTLMIAQDVVIDNIHDTDLPAVQTVVDAIPTTAMRGTDSAALASAWTAALATALSAYTAAKAAYLDEAISAAKKVLSTDWKGSFNWDTSAYTTDEIDISTLFSTNLALTIRRKYSVKLDLTNVEADGSFVSLYIAVKEKIDGTNYRAIDRKLVEKADIAASTEPGIIIDIPATSENIQITMVMTTALAGDATVYYAVVKEHLE